MENYFEYCKYSHSPLRWQVAGNTDIGGGHENQDDMFLFEERKLGVCVIGVLDGHGRDVGKLAATSGRIFLKAFFEKHYKELFSEPYELLVRAHKEAHAYIKEAFRVSLQNMGWEVMDYGGYLLKRKAKNRINLTIDIGNTNVDNSKISSPPSKKANNGWQCVHGGTSCSIVALVGSCMYIANVGDSSATLSSASKIFHSITTDPSVLRHIGDSDPDSVVNVELGSGEGDLGDDWTEEDGDATAMSVSDHLDSNSNVSTNVSGISNVDMQLSCDSYTNPNTSGLEAPYRDMNCSSDTMMTSQSTIVSSAIFQPSDSICSLPPPPTDLYNKDAVKTNIHECMKPADAELLPSGLRGRCGDVMRHYLRKEVDANASEGCGNSVVAKDYGSNTLLISAEHSPESVTEYLRMLKSHPSATNNTVCDLLVVYDDSRASSKVQCPSIFSYNDGNELIVTNKGKYYKNVRCEWASLVATPPTAEFVDALAFTRSLGDFHLHAYGVSECPEVHRIDLHPLFDRQTKVKQMKSEVEHGDVPAVPMLCVCLATGIVFCWFANIYLYLFDYGLLTPTL